MNLTELSKTIRFDNASKGFDPIEVGVARYLLLAISELCEAQNELRDGHDIYEVYYTGAFSDEDGASHPATKPEGFKVEIADAIIRLLDIACKFNIEIDTSSTLTLEDDTIDESLLAIIHQISEIALYKPHEFYFKYELNVAIASLYLFCNIRKLNIDSIIDEKLAYNRTRPAKHGRKF